MVSAHVPEMKPTGLADRLGKRGQEMQVKTLSLKSNRAKEDEALLKEHLLSGRRTGSGNSTGMWSQREDLVVLGSCLWV